MLSGTSVDNLLNKIDSSSVYEKTGRSRLPTAYLNCSNKTKIVIVGDLMGNEA